MTTERKADKWLDRKLERRTLLKKAAIGGASLAVLYVAPKFTSAGSRPAYATTGVGTCTPGFWKNDHDHINEAWTASGYSRGHLFKDVFGTGGNDGFGSEIPLDLTLQQALEMGSGCPAALVRHATAAVLNAAAGDIVTPDEATIKSDTNNALAGGGGTTNCNDVILPLKDGYDILNNGSCLDA